MKKFTAFSVHINGHLVRIIGLDGKGRDVRETEDLHMENEKKEFQIIAVDFDGTLCTDCYPGIGAPNLPLICLLKQLKEQGKQLILWTCRCQKELREATDWCDAFGLVFDAVNENVPEIIEKYGTDSRKIYADVYIDDKACFPWENGNERRKENENN